MTGPYDDEITTHSYISQRLRLHYVDWGNDGAPPLILLHGGMDHSRNWDWVARELRQDFHVIAPDLRGHGDSQWSADGNYQLHSHVYDLAQLIQEQKLAPVAIVGHSLGGNIALRYTGAYPETVSKIVAIEGLGLPPAMEAERAAMSVDERLRKWIDEQRSLSRRSPRHYGSLDEAIARMEEANPRLSPAQARHLTIHGINQNEDGTYSWKFDNYVRPFSPVGLTPDELHHLWSRITCPTLLIHGCESWASDPSEDGSLAYFRAARLAKFEGAGHWVHHDRLKPFVDEVKKFLLAGDSQAPDQPRTVIV